MLQRLLALLWRKKPEADDIVEEKWSSGFSPVKKRRFQEEQTKDFRALRQKGHLLLDLNKKNLFAWTVQEPYRYRNLVVEAEVSFGERNGHSAAGLMFRYKNPENYYYALLSNRGQFRFDVVFNGNPSTLIPWLDVRDPDETRHFKLRVIINYDNFAFFLNDRWIAELKDESFDNGYLAFCGQNYDESDKARFSLEHIFLESRPVEVDVWFYRWTRVIPVDRERRIALAERLSGQGQFTPALIQLRRAYHKSEPDAHGAFLIAEIYLKLELYEDALRYLDICLSQDPRRIDARLERANVLYLLNRFLEARTQLSGTIEAVAPNPVAWNLYGNIEYALGNWNEAKEAYHRGVRLNAEEPLFFLNYARACDRAGLTEEARGAYAEAARLFFRQQDFGDLPGIFSRMSSLDPDNGTVKSVRAKLLFQEGRSDEAEELFLDLIKKEQAESEIFFLQGLLLAQRARHEEALKYFDQAIERHADFYLYHMRRAESVFALGGDPDRDLTRAAQLSPDDPWVHNLAGLVAMERGEYPRAIESLKRAEELLPEEEEIKVNLAEVLYRSTSLEAALQVLSSTGALSCNQRGNLFAAEGRIDEAVDEYRRAVQLDPEAAVYRENLAAALWEAGQINEADEQLARLLELSPSRRAYELIGQVAYKKGEYQRALSAWQAASDIEPPSDGLKLQMARAFFYIGEPERARTLVEELIDGEVSAEAENILEQIRRLTEDRYQCDQCGRQWWVPKDLPPQGSLRLVGEPPDEMPAGQCPSCGRIYCVACAKEHMIENRFVCPHCQERLKLLNDALKYLAASILEQYSDVDK
ncbi:MAG TPA: tetratricopeptide repeat protein [Sediminispirochaeta sp.]|nr:tetratricopeptide repeat protein [Sediminispirochaeta sp.]